MILGKNGKKIKGRVVLYRTFDYFLLSFPPPKQNKTMPREQSISKARAPSKRRSAAQKVIDAATEADVEAWHKQFAEEQEWINANFALVTDQAAPSGPRSHISWTSSSDSAILSQRDKIAIERFPKPRIPRFNSTAELINGWRQEKKKASEAQNLATVVLEEVRYRSRDLENEAVNARLRQAIDGLGYSYGRLLGWQKHFNGKGYQHSKEGRRNYSAGHLAEQNESWYNALVPFHFEQAQPGAVHLHRQDLPNRIIAIKDSALRGTEYKKTQYPSQ